MWSVIGAIAEATDLPVTTGVTCPTVRIHPAIIAQAAATSAVMTGGRFNLGVGSGEALNEHILGDHWPEADVRLEMLREAVEVMRTLWEGGQRSHRGRHYTVENARVYDLPEAPPPVIVSGFGPKAVALAAEIGDGFATTSPDKDAIERYRSEGGKRPGARRHQGLLHGQRGRGAQDRPPAVAQRGAARRAGADPPDAVALRAGLRARDARPAVAAHGPDLDAHAATLQEYADAGVDELFVQQIGPAQDAFFTTGRRRSCRGSIRPRGCRGVCVRTRRWCRRSRPGSSWSMATVHEGM